jgi:hypothetical protein
VTPVDRFTFTERELHILLRAAFHAGYDDTHLGSDAREVHSLGFANETIAELLRGVPVAQFRKEPKER